MTAPTKISLIGLGRMGKIYARAITRMNEAELYAIATVELERERAFLRDLDVPHVYDAADPALTLDEVDAVVIATPTSTHRVLVEGAAAAGKAIFCEKPLALTLDDTRRMLDAVDRAGVPLQVGFMRRFDERFEAAKKAIDAERIGRPVTFKGVGRDPRCPDPAYADPACSGGLIIDMAIHDFDLARWLMGAEVDRVSAEGTTMVCEELAAVGDVDNAVVNLRFENGAVGQVEVSRNASYGYDVRAEVLGTKGAVRVGLDDHGTQLVVHSSAPSGDFLEARFGAAYRRQLREFVRCLRDGIPPRPTGHDALAAFEIALAATYSAESGRPVTLEALRSGWTPTSMPA